VHSDHIRLIVFLLLSLISTIILGVLQLFFLLEIFYEVSVHPGLSNEIKTFFPVYFLLFALVFFGRHLVIMLFAFLEVAKISPDPSLGKSGFPTVSILVPAHNEADVIEQTIASLLRVDYPDLEIVVVDDGSTDNTFDRVKPYVGMHGDRVVSLIKKSQGGKASALNAAFHQSRGRFVLSMDADSQLADDSVRRLLTKFQEKQIGLCCGQVSIINRVNLLTHMQSLEYTIMNGMARAFQSYFQSVLIAPGPITMYRRETLDMLMEQQRRSSATAGEIVDGQGPWETDTFAEDAKLSLSLLAFGVGSVYEPAALCHTLCPATIDRLLNQRYRWIRGNLQAIKRSWSLWIRDSSGRRELGLWLLWFALEAVFWPFLGVLGLAIFVVFLLMSGGFSSVYLWFGLLMLSDLSAAAFAIAASGRYYSSLLLMPLYRLFYQPLLEFNSVFAIIDEIRDYRMRW
jgi:cellulose synthase/poly-beta-1,6-N-acetylglucosamine synthase-like glycosyltransferase